MNKVYNNSIINNNLIMSLHSVQRSQQRGIRHDDINLINEEGSHFKSSHHKGLYEVLFTRKGKKRFAGQLHNQIKDLKIVKNKQICKKKIQSINDEITILKKKIQKSDKLEGKFMVVSNNIVVTCYKKNKTNNLRKYLTKHKYRKFIK